MRIHTDLTYRQMFEVLRQSGAPIDYEVLTEHGSRSKERAFEVRLSGTGGRNNTGLYGAGNYEGATWDEWGAFFGALYDMDPEARSGGSVKTPVYRDRQHYHFLTGDRFQKRYPYNPDGPYAKVVPSERGTYLPADTHPRHQWQYEGSWGDHGAAGFRCTYTAHDATKRQCSATRPSWKQVEAYAPRAYDVA